MSSKMSANGLHQLIQPHRFRTNDPRIERRGQVFPKSAGKMDEEQTS